MNLSHIYFSLYGFQVDSYQNTQTRESLSLDYVSCLMKYSNPANGPFVAGPRCAQELQLKNWNVIEQCANTTEGSKLLQHHGETTHQLRPELTFVPWINFNHVNYFIIRTVCTSLDSFHFCI